MSAIDDALQSHQHYFRRFALGHLPVPPATRLTVLTCMDARMQIEPMLGLAPGDAHILRNAGGIATEDALRSLILSQRLLGTREVMVIGHTGCGLATFRDPELRRRLERETGSSPEEPRRFHSFTGLEQNVLEQVTAIRAHPWILPETLVRGFVYDVRDGSLAEVA